MKESTPQSILRPKGVTIIAVYCFLCLLPSALMALIALISGPPDKTIGEGLIRWALVLSPFIFLAAGVGLFKMRRWGMWCTLLVAIIMLYWDGLMISDIFQEVNSGKRELSYYMNTFNYVLFSLLTVPSIIIIIYLILKRKLFLK